MPNDTTKETRIPATLAEALVAFQAELPHVGKTETAKIPTKAGGSYSYRYADLSTVLDAVMPRLTACGLSFSARPERESDGTYSLVGVLRHGLSGETDEGRLPLFTRGTAQETGSSITYARRYLLLPMIGVAADEDDDGATASQGHARQVQEQVDADRAAAALDVARTNAYQRWAKVMHDEGGSTDRAAFIASIENVYALPFSDVGIEQLDGFAS